MPFIFFQAQYKIPVYDTMKRKKRLYITPPPITFGLASLELRNVFGKCLFLFIENKWRNGVDGFFYSFHDWCLIF